MTLDFFLLMHSLFILYQLNMRNMCYQYRLATYILIHPLMLLVYKSSAYIFSTHASTAKLEMLLINDKNKIGPGTDPVERRM